MKYFRDKIKIHNKREGSHPAYLSFHLGWKTWDEAKVCSSIISATWTPTYTAFSIRGDQEARVALAPKAAVCVDASTIPTQTGIRWTFVFI